MSLWCNIPGIWGWPRPAWCTVGASRRTRRSALQTLSPVPIHWRQFSCTFSQCHPVPALADAWRCSKGTKWACRPLYRAPFTMNETSRNLVSNQVLAEHLLQTWPSRLLRVFLCHSNCLGPFSVLGSAGPRKPNATLSNSLVQIIKFNLIHLKTRKIY